jgi:hypothetical protein
LFVELTGFFFVDVTWSLDVFVLCIALTILELNHKDCSVPEKPMSKNFVSTTQGAWAITEKPPLKVLWELTLDNFEMLPWESFGFEGN